jgi:mRNA interferase MazF
MFHEKYIGARPGVPRSGKWQPIAQSSGDIIWLDFLQPVGNEQGGRQPALVLSPRPFNELAGRCMACPITSHDRDRNLQVVITDICEISGVVQTDQLRSASWEQRASRFICQASPAVPEDVRAKLRALLEI